MTYSEIYLPYIPDISFSLCQADDSFAKLMSLQDSGDQLFKRGFGRMDPEL